MDYLKNVLKNKKYLLAIIIAAVVILVTATLIIVAVVKKNKKQSADMAAANNHTNMQNEQNMTESNSVNLNQSATQETLQNQDETATDQNDDSNTEDGSAENGDQNESDSDGQNAQADAADNNGSAVAGSDGAGSYAEAENDAGEPQEEAPDDSNQDFVAGLSVASRTNQLIIVSASGSTAQVSMHETDGSGNWVEIMRTSGYVGGHGVGKASENDTKTPSGCYSLSRPFGVNANPGCGLGYTQVDDSHYWIDDPSSPHYNEFVSTDSVECDWDSAEHLISYPTQYAYAIAIDYNTNCTPGAGSAIFLHCANGRPTAGCVSIPQSQMIFVLQNIRSGCLIVIDTEGSIMSY